MRNLLLNQLIEKNKLQNDSVYIVLCEIRLTESNVIRICNNNESVEWNGFMWIPFVFEMAEIKAKSNGASSQVALTISNRLRLFQRDIEASQGGTGVDVFIRVVSSETIDDPYPQIEEVFGVETTEINVDTIVFTLGLGVPINTRFPERRHLKNFCEFEYGGVECAAPFHILNTHKTCNKTLSDCEARQNTVRFGGEVAIGEGGFTS